MAVSLIGANGLFTRLGKIWDLGLQLITWQNAVITEVDDIDSVYNAADRDMAAPITAQQDNMTAGISSAFTPLLQSSEKTLVDMFIDDRVLPTPTVLDALLQLRRQMEADSDTIQESVVSVSATPNPNNGGNGGIIESIIDVEGRQIPHARAEDIEMVCVADRNTTGSGAETFIARGEAAASSWDRTWPAGSSLAATVRCGNAADDGGSELGYNVLTNSDFEDWTGNVPDQWTVPVGGGTVAPTPVPHRQLQALSITGDGTTLTELRQVLGDSAAGSGGYLNALTKVSISVWVRNDGTAPGAGTLEISLRSANGVLLAADTLLSIDLTTATAEYQMYSVAFNIPASVPAATRVQIALTAPLTGGRAVYVDSLVIAPMVPLSPSGPWVLIVAGSTDWALDDRITVTVANDYSSQMAQEMDRYYNLHKLGIAIPSSATPTVPDSLIS